MSRPRRAKPGDPPPAAPADTAEIPTATVEQVREALLRWYRSGHRDLPWRKLSDPYAIWVSEIMLQQTRVDTVKEYFRRFMTSFPTVRALAEAPLEQVLGHWSGLGYYARARNMHAAAQQILAAHEGEFPREPPAVRALPGIGPYTAGAILSIAFGERAALLDGNVIRVLARLFAIAEAPTTAPLRRRYWSLSEALVPPPRAPSSGTAPLNDPGDFNQALMELGATVCLPQRPVCLVCPLATACTARRAGDPEDYPAKQAAREVPLLQVVILVLRRRDGRVLLLRRPPLGLWGGLWEPATWTLADDETPAQGLSRLLRERLNLKLSTAPARPLQPFIHLLTHREMHFAPYLLDWPDAADQLQPSGYEEARWVDIAAGPPLALGLSAWVSALLARIKKADLDEDRQGATQ